MVKREASIKRLLQRIYTDESIPKENIDFQQRVVLLNIIFTIGIVCLTPYSVIAYLQGNFWLGVFDLATVGILVSAYFHLRRSKNFTLSGYIGISVVSVLLLYVTSTGGVNNTGPLWSYVMPLYTLFLLGTKKGSIAISVYFIIVLLILFLPGTPLLFTTYSTNFKIRYVTTFAAVYIIAFFSEWVRANTQKKMIKKTKELERTLKELRKTEAERSRLHDELLTAKKMEAIGILAGGIAHDFNNLLSIISGNVSIAIEEVEDNPGKAVKMLKNAEISSFQAAEVAQKLITFSNGGWIIPQKINLSTILNSVMEYHPEMKPFLRNTFLPPELKPLYGDERQLREVIYNLLKNADEATSESKRITFKAENVTLSKKNSLSLKQGDYIKISITDNGRGIPQEHLEKIFDPYFSTKDTVTQKGMGLGLAICYSIVNRHNGHIAVESEMGKGTTVNVHLPTFNA
jgi:signal transduction histidine kinase